MGGHGVAASEMDGSASYIIRAFNVFVFHICHINC
ncbi:hypothetical protein COLO4_03843 [Corchorus olitorius]|uniref:Uncharacterized protein n=1 Tax=Corchorus olitorius TaxID=93759 RepID=A0A1R3KW96_9ROSI|nr:hypothetical protein COLO4_03843 [Corchorus olitorius]